jgi:acetyltransferase EpsM
MKKKLFIIGSGDHAKIIYEEAKNQKQYKLLGFLENNINKINKKISINNFELINKIKLNKNIFFILGIGNNFKREKIIKKISKLKNINWATIISKKANLSKNTFVGEGTFIGQGVEICNNVTIGRHCIINTSTSIDHDNKFEDFSSTGPGVVTGGNVNVGKNSHIGIGAVVKNNIKINKNIIIGGNSFVSRSCIKQGTYFGSPAKFFKYITKDFNYLK